MSNDFQKILHAAAYAARMHENQRRKNLDKTPYINHPLEVAQLLADVGNVTDANLLMAAILHDTVEDTDALQEDIERDFGSDVAGLVAEVTDDKSLPKAERKQKQIESAPHKSDRAKLIKLTDKINNISGMDATSPAGWPQQRKVEYLAWARKVIAGCRGVSPPLDALFDETVDAAEKRVTS